MHPLARSAGSNAPRLVSFAAATTGRSLSRPNGLSCMSVGLILERLAGSLLSLVLAAVGHGASSNVASSPLAAVRAASPPDSPVEPPEWMNQEGLSACGAGGS